MLILQWLVETLLKAMGKGQKKSVAGSAGRILLSSLQVLRLWFIDFLKASLAAISEDVKLFI